MARRKPGKRVNGRLSRSKESLAERNPPADHILELRRLFSFVHPPKQTEGRGGEIDQEICDGIGQLHAVGLLEGHGYDPLDLRNVGRQWGAHYARLLRPSGFKMGNFERADKSHGSPPMNAADYTFDAQDEALSNHYDRWALIDLLVAPEVGSTPDGGRVADWAAALIARELREKHGKFTQIARFPTSTDQDMLDGAIRALCTIYEATLKPYLRRAA